MTIDDRAEAPSRSVDFRDLFRKLRTILRAEGRDQEQALQAIVELIAAQFQSEVCSLYQSDEASDALLLRATKGLRPEAVGRTALGPGEGLVGTIAESRQPLALEDAQADERFAFRPETGEDIYQSFLGVPLIRAYAMLGVLVIQHRERRRYNAEEIEGCETVAQFLSEMLRQPAPRKADYRDAGPGNSLRLPATPISPGLAAGRTVLHLKDIVIGRWRASDAAHELVRMNDALRDLEETLLTLQKSSDTIPDSDTRELLEADLMLARDKGWHVKIEAAIGRGLSAEAAVQTVRENLRARMQAVSNEYIRERLLDLDELSHRLLAILSGAGPQHLSNALQPGSILVCRSLAAAELLHAGPEKLSGLVITDATPNSHLAIIARALKIPALGQVPGALTDLNDGDPVVLDAVSGQLIARPDEEVLAQFESRVAQRREREANEQLLGRGPCTSRDGVRVLVAANAGLLVDLKEIVQLEVDGIGLYRTEVAFLVRDAFPSVEEQAQLYGRIYDRMNDKPVVFRTLDIGSDKKLPYFPGQRKESNPALGWRAIRIGLDHPALLRDQLRALVMAADGRPLRIMLPMISEPEELAAARALLTRVIEDHTKNGGKAPGKLEVGAMIEVPALLWDLDELFELADFASVGTNDLFQFLNAADRNNPKTSRRFEALKPANLRLLMEIAASARRAGKQVSVCGELAGTPLGAIALLGCGFRAVSMDCVRIAEIRSVIRAVDVALAEKTIAALAERPAGTVRDDITILAQEFGVELQ